MAETLDIERRAYQIWEEEGRPDGRAEEHWRQAEEDLRERDADRQSGPDAEAPSFT